MKTTELSTDPTTNPSRRHSSVRTVVRAIIVIALITAAGYAVTLPEGLPHAARITLFGFAVATVLWTLTSITAAYVALACVLLIVALGGTSQESLFDSLASDVIWLMIGAFVLGGAMRACGLADRLTATALRRPRTVGGAFWMVTVVLMPLSVVIPSTSGRAAVVLPLFKSLSDLFNDRVITRALALLMPTIILVTTMATVIGAASHLIAIDLLDQVTGETISFAQWALWGVPFGIVIALMSCFVVTRMFLDRERRSRQLPQLQENHVQTMPESDSSPNPASRSLRFTRDERFTSVVLGIMIILWLTQSLHGLEIATVTILGAVVLAAPHFGVLTWKQGVASVSWNLIIFVGAALALGGALIDSGAGEWIIGSLFSLGGIDSSSPSIVVLLFITVLTLTSHLYLTSHTVRAVALVPPLLYMATSMDLNPTAVIFLATVGMDFSLTLPVSSKAILLFHEAEVETFTSAQLMRLSAVLLIIHAALMVIFYYGYWQWAGLAL